MAKPPKKWAYINIELEIDGRVVESMVATQCTFEKKYTFLLREGQTQRLPWAIFISLFYYQKPKIVNSGMWRDRDKNGRFIKSNTILNTNTV